MGREVHKDSMAIAYVGPAHHAAGTALGAIGTRQCAIAPLIRKRQSKSTPLVFVYAAGPCGDWRDRSLTKKGHVCWVVAPSLLPQKAGDRGQPHRRDALQVARLLRSGALPPVEVPQVGDEAIRDLRRAREEALRDLKTAPDRLKAVLLRHESRATGQAPWGPAPCAGAVRSAVPHPHSPWSAKKTAAR